MEKAVQDPRFNDPEETARRRKRLMAQYTNARNTSIKGGNDEDRADGDASRELGNAAENLYRDECKLRKVKVKRNDNQSGVYGDQRVIDFEVTSDNVDKTKYLIQVKSTKGPDDGNHMATDDKRAFKRHAKKGGYIAYEVHYNANTGARTNTKIYAPKGSNHEPQ